MVDESIVVSVHDHPRRWLRQFSARLIALALIVCLFALLLQLVLTILISPLFLGTAVFTLILTIPLLLQTVLHPAITVLDSGLRLRPQLWREDTIHWRMISSIAEHPLIYQDPVIERRLHGKNFRLRQGCVIILCEDATVSPLFRLVGGIAGSGLHPAFAISSTTHRDYERLLQLLEEHGFTTPVP
ncbi:MAG: hypothetical protein U0528_15200 [Anaerolineae bacterium]